MDSSLPGSSVHGILQARVLGGVPLPSPGYLPDPGIEPRSPALQADALTSEPPGNSTFNASFFLKKGINLHRKLSVLPASECLNKCLLLKPHF